MQKRWFTLVNAQSLSDSPDLHSIPHRGRQNLRPAGQLPKHQRRHLQHRGQPPQHGVEAPDPRRLARFAQPVDGLRRSPSTPIAAAKCPPPNLTLDAAGVIDEDCTIQFWQNEDDDTALPRHQQLSVAVALLHQRFHHFRYRRIRHRQGPARQSRRCSAIRALPPPAGFLLAKEFTSFTPATSGIIPQLLPLDLPYVALMTLTGVSGKNPLTAISNLELQIDSGLVILYNRATLSIAKDSTLTLRSVHPGLSSHRGRNR